MATMKLSMRHDLPCTPDEFWAQLNLLNEHYAGRPGYAGTLVHSYRGLRGLLLGE